MAIMTDIRRKFPILKNRTPEPETTVPCPPAETAPQAAVVEIPVTDIIPNRAQPRTAFNQNAIARLAEIDGRSVTEEIVDDIFHRFCVGK